MGAAQAQSKLKVIEKIEASMGPEVTSVNDRPPPSLKLPKPPRGSKTLLTIKNGVVSWSKKSPTGENSISGETVVASKPIVSGVNLTIERGMRIAVRGPNGAGKTTLLSALSGRMRLE